MKGEDDNLKEFSHKKESSGSKLIDQLKIQIVGLTETNVRLKDEVELLRREVEFNRRLVKDLVKMKKPAFAVISYDKGKVLERNSEQSKISENCTEKTDEDSPSYRSGPQVNGTTRTTSVEAHSGKNRDPDVKYPPVLSDQFAVTDEDESESDDANNYLDLSANASYITNISCFCGNDREEKSNDGDNNDSSRRHIKSNINGMRSDSSTKIGNIYMDNTNNSSTNNNKNNINNSINKHQDNNNNINNNYNDTKRRLTKDDIEKDVYHVRDSSGAGYFCHPLSTYRNNKFTSRDHSDDKSCENANLEKKYSCDVDTNKTKFEESIESLPNEGKRNTNQELKHLIRKRRFSAPAISLYQTTLQRNAGTYQNRCTPTCSSNQLQETIPQQYIEGWLPYCGSRPLKQPNSEYLRQKENGTFPSRRASSSCTQNTFLSVYSNLNSWMGSMTFPNNHMRRNSTGSTNLCGVAKKNKSTTENSLVSVASSSKLRRKSTGSMDRFGNALREYGNSSFGLKSSDQKSVYSGVKRRSSASGLRYCQNESLYLTSENAKHVFYTNLKEEIQFLKNLRKHNNLKASAKQPCLWIPYQSTISRSKETINPKISKDTFFANKSLNDDAQPTKLSSLLRLDRSAGECSCNRHHEKRSLTTEFQIKQYGNEVDDRKNSTQVNGSNNIQPPYFRDYKQSKPVVNKNKKDTQFGHYVDNAGFEPDSPPWYDGVSSEGIISPTSSMSNEYDANQLFDDPDAHVTGVYHDDIRELNGDIVKLKYTPTAKKNSPELRSNASREIKIRSSKINNRSIDRYLSGKSRITNQLKKGHSFDDSKKNTSVENKRKLSSGSAENRKISATCLEKKRKLSATALEIYRTMTKSRHRIKKKSMQRQQQNPSGTQFHLFACKYTGNLTRDPVFIPGVLCGFLEYPYSENGPPSAKTSIQETINPGCSSSAEPSSSKEPSENLRPLLNVKTLQHSEDIVKVKVNGEQRDVDMELIKPHLKCIYHGGRIEVGEKFQDVIVFVAHFLPTKDTPNYQLIMENLFYYSMYVTDELVEDTYQVVFFNSCQLNNMPSHTWIQNYYDCVFYRLKKNLSAIYFVHQSLWLKTALKFSKLFLRPNCRNKIHLIQNVEHLQTRLPLDVSLIPENVHTVDKFFK